MVQGEYIVRHNILQSYNGFKMEMRLPDMQKDILLCRQKCVKNNNDKKTDTVFQVKKSWPLLLKNEIIKMRPFPCMTMFLMLNDFLVWFALRALTEKTENIQPCLGREKRACFTYYCTTYCAFDGCSWWIHASCNTRSFCEKTKPTK